MNLTDVYLVVGASIFIEQVMCFGLHEGQGIAMVIEHV
jgi:hypothetical protein